MFAQEQLWENWEPKPMWFAVLLAIGFWPMGFVGFWLEKRLVERHVAKQLARSIPKGEEPIREPKDDEGV